VSSAPAREKKERENFLVLSTRTSCLLGEVERRRDWFCLEGGKRVRQLLLPRSDLPAHVRRRGGRENLLRLQDLQKGVSCSAFARVELWLGAGGCLMFPGEIRLRSLRSEAAEKRRTFISIYFEATGKNVETGRRAQVLYRKKLEE